MNRMTTFYLAGLLAASSVAANAAETLKLATIAPGTSAYLTMSTFASLINQNQADYDIRVDATGVATKHGIELSQGKLDMAMTSPTVYHWLLNGLAMYQKVPDHAELASRQRLLLWFPYGQYHVVVHEDSGIRTLQDLKGKKVFLGPPGGGAWTAARDWVKATTGLDPEAGDFENVKASWASAFQGFQDRHFDVYVNGGIAPFPQVEQLSLTSEIRLLGLDQAGYEASQSAKDYLAALNGRELGVIEQGVYGDKVKMDHDIYTLGSAVGIMARADMDDDQVYKLTQAFWDNIDEARASTPWLTAITLDYAVHEGGMPLHPGALRYYEEAGVTIPEASKP